MSPPRWVIPLLVAFAVALVAAADRLPDSPAGVAAAAVLLLGAPALVAGPLPASALRAVRRRRLKAQLQAGGAQRPDRILDEGA
jgi:hypothetical protein